MKTHIGIPALTLAAALFAMAAVPATPVMAGPMKGLAGHVASGSATIQAGKVVMAPDFVFDGGPDVYVAVRKDGELHLLDKLRNNSGAQSYSLPASGGEGASEIVLWCKKFNVALAKAPIN